VSLIKAPDPAWPDLAAEECDFWHSDVVGVVEAHHIGSTAVPGLPAKPVIDLLVVFNDAEIMKTARKSVEDAGYEWLGEYGLPGRAYARRDLTVPNARKVHAHCYPSNHPAIARHLAFRDALRGNGALRAAYTSIKAAAAARHPEGGPDYQAEKSGWIDKVEARALADWLAPD